MQLVTLAVDAGAPQPLFVEFVNTLHWFEGAPIELIGSPADLRSWLAERRLDLAPADAALAELHALREHVRSATRALASGTRPEREDLQTLQAALASPGGSLALADAPSAEHPAARQPDAASPELRLAFQTDAADAEVLAFRVALSLATFLVTGDQQRLKLCANPGCGFAFIDTSANNSRRWCYMRFCGNRFKVRAFRSRRVSHPPAT